MDAVIPSAVLMSVIVPWCHVLVRRLPRILMLTLSWTSCWTRTGTAGEPGGSGLSGWESGRNHLFWGGGHKWKHIELNVNENKARRIKQKQNPAPSFASGGFIEVVVVRLVDLSKVEVPD